MGRVKDYYDISLNKPCFGGYEPSQLCDHCWAAELCKQEAMRLDGYYDRQAEQRAWWEDYECSHH